MKTHLTLYAASLASLMSACSPDFDPYNEISGLRVLALQAEPADLSVTQTTRVSALTFEEKDRPVSLEWSLCPWPSDPNAGFACAVDAATWQKAWKAAGFTGNAPSLTLGTAEQAELAFPGTRAQAQSLCEHLGALLQSSATLPPDCTRSWPWTVRLSARAGKEHVETVKDVQLLIDAKLVPNHNPTLDALQVEAKQGMQVLDAQMARELASGEDHKLRAQAPSRDIETYQRTPALGQPQPKPERESLTFTWFISRGSTKYVRTTFRDGVESLKDATENEWHAPDETGDTTLFVVVRDHRGGVGFRTGKVRLTD
jgi:hypothetical protein